MIIKPEHRTLEGCQRCAYRIASQEEAERLLKDVIKTAHMRTIRGGGVLMEARLTKDTVLKLCLWEAHCEDCEAADAYDNTIEHDSQYDSEAR